MAVTLTHDFSTKTGEPIDGAEVQQNFDDLKDAVENRAPLRGITTANMTDKYAVWCEVVDLVSYEVSGSVATPVQEAPPASMTTVKQFRVRVPAGRKSALCIVELKAEAVTSTGGSPQVQVLVAGATLGGAAVLIDSTSVKTLERTNPFDNELTPVDDQTVIAFQLGISGGTPTVRGLTATCWFKMELYR